MTKNDFIQLLEEPSLVGASHIVNLQAIVKEYPYFQSSHSLLTKAFHQSGNINFESQLKNTAAYAADRKQLHHLLFVEAPKQFPVKEIETKEEDISIQETSIHPPKESDNKMELIQPKSEPPIKETGESESDDILEKQLLSNAISSSILMEVSNEIPQIEELQPSSERALETEQASPLPTPEPFDEETTHSFSEWIHFFGDENKETTPTLDHEASNITMQALDEYQIERKKTEFFSATKMARLSVQEDDDLVTETLANIYADQENYDKAIKAFEKLQLKYPEKSVYFAGRIKEIQNQIN